MNDILKYWPINFDYEGEPMSVPMGEIIGIEKMQDVNCRIHTRNSDTWTTNHTTYENVMDQWVGALKQFGGPQ